MNLFTGYEDLKRYAILVDEIQKKEEEKQYKKDLPPSYLKFYSIYQYDRLKFRKLFNEWLETDEGKNRTYEILEKKQKEILEKCYKKDKIGKLRDSDERHIFRYPDLYKIYKMIYNRLDINPLEDFEIKDFKGFIIWKNKYRKEKYLYKGDEYQGQEFIEYGATIKGSEDMPLFKRIKIHIRLLRLLNKGVDLERALLLLR